MYLKSLHIRNFRCFADYTIDFAPGVTVLFGKNGSGKTTLIHAIHKALSFMMHSEKIKEKDLKTKKLKPVGEKSIRSGNPYVNVEGFSLMGDVHSEAAKPAEYLLEVSASAELDKQTPLEWAISAYAVNCRLRPSEYRDAFLRLYDWYLSSNELPLLAYYSDSFPHVVPYTLTNKKEKSREAYHVKTNFAELGYTEWNSDKGFTNTWIERLKSKLFNVRDIPHEIDSLEENHKAGHVTEEEYTLQKDQLNYELQTAKREIAAITDCLNRFFKGDNYYEIVSLGLGRYRRNEIYYIASSGKRGSIRELPAGYKRLVYIVLDIAYRAYLLSGRTSTDIPGIVIIDEIDLHLHPELEQVVLQRLTNTFPSVQFIVSTHSPLVLTGIETSNRSNVVLHLQPDSNGPKLLQNVYGIDCNQMLEENMDVAKRNSEIDELFKKAWNEVAAKNIEEAKKTIQALEATSTPSDQTELVKLRAVVSRLEIIGR